METIITKENFLFLKFIEFKNITLWDVKRFVLQKINSKYMVVELGSYIKEENYRIKPYEFPNENFKILGVNNKIGIFDAYIQKGEEIKQPYKKVEIGFLAYNPYRINVGSIGVRTEENNFEYISPAYVVFSCKKQLIPDFLYKVFSTDFYNKIIRQSTTGSVRQNLTFDILETLKIPLPNVDIQEKLLQFYYQRIYLADSQERQADELEKGIDEYLFEELGVQIIKGIASKFQLSLINFAKLNRWGVAFINNSNTADKLLISKKYPNEPLIKYVEINPQTSFANLGVSDISFLPMECISDEFGEVKEYYEGKKENSNGYTKFIEGDLLWSKITPCMQNGKSAIVTGLKNGYGYGSTEYHVLRQISDKIDLEFVYHILRTKYILKQGTYHFTGSAGQQRVPSDFLKELFIPFPPLEKQKEVSKQIKIWKTEIKNLRDQAKANKETAIKEFEKEIFGA